MQYAPPVLAAQPASGRNCGIDWARDDHAITIVDSDSRAGRRRVSRQLLYRRNGRCRREVGVVSSCSGRNGQGGLRRVGGRRDRGRGDLGLVSLSVGRRRQRTERPTVRGVAESVDDATVVGRHPRHVHRTRRRHRGEHRPAARGRAAGEPGDRRTVTVRFCRLSSFVDALRPAPISLRRTPAPALRNPRDRCCRSSDDRAAPRSERRRRGW